jgi:tetratricopeptide (TPR) repeat protein
MESCLALIQEERFEEARARLQPVVANHPEWARAQFYVALTYHMDHRYEAAREWFERALELDPEYHTVRVYHGWCLYYLGDLDAARAMFESYLAVKPGYADAIFALGLIDFDEDGLESAQARFVETIAIAQAANNAGTEAKARARLADVYIRKDEFAKARAELERSIALEPENYEPYYKLSRVLLRLGDADGSAAAQRKHDEVRASKRPAPGRERYP